MRMRMPPPPTPTPMPMLSSTHHRHLRTIITLFILIAGANAFTHPITTTNRLSLSHTSNPSSGSPSSPSTSSVLLQHDHHRFEQCHRQRRWDRSSRLVISLSSSSTSSSSGASQDAASSSNSNLVPKTFREGEIIGLRYMQDGMHEEALKGKRSRNILRKSNLCTLIILMINYPNYMYSIHSQLHALAIDVQTPTSTYKTINGNSQSLSKSNDPPWLTN